MVKVALVTGANRGIGKEVSLQLLQNGCAVILAARTFDKAEKSCRELLGAANIHPNQFLMPLELDISSQDSIDGLKKAVEDKKIPFPSILINNAGVYLDNPQTEEKNTFLEIPINLLHETLQTNLYGTIHLTQVLLPQMMVQGYGRVVNVASGMGRVIELDRYAPYYRISKASILTFTKIAADTCKEYEDILINAVCPGWVRTDMGGKNALRSVEEGAKGIVDAALMEKGSPSGVLLRDGKVFDWQEPTDGAKPKQDALKD